MSLLPLGHDGPVTISPDDLPGCRLDGVTVAWHEYEGRRNEDDPDLWLHLDRLGLVHAYCAGDGSLDLRLDAPPVSIDMEEFGRICVEAAEHDFVLSPFIGAQIRATRDLRDTEINFVVGLVLEFDDGAVGIANKCDDLVVAAWPSQKWADVSIELGPGTSGTTSGERGGANLS